MDKEDNIINLEDYKGKNQPDIETIIQIHDKIATLKNKQFKMKLERAWREVAISLFLIPRS